MQRRRLGGLEVSGVGLGCATMTPFYDEPDRDSTIDTLRRAREIGVNFLDSSDAYGQGRNEELIAILTKRRHPPPCQGATAAQISAGRDLGGATGRNTAVSGRIGRSRREAPRSRRPGCGDRRALPSL